MIILSNWNYGLRCQNVWRGGWYNAIDDVIYIYVYDILEKLQWFFYQIEIRDCYGLKFMSLFLRYKRQ